MTNSVSTQQTEAIKSPLQQTSGIALSEAAVEVKIYHTWAELEALRSKWNEILHSAAGSSIFSTPEWLGAWWQSYGEGGQLIAVAVFTSGFLVGLAPLYTQSVQPLLGSALRVLRFVGDGSRDSDNLSFIIRAGYEELFVKGFVNWFAQQCNWDLCRLHTMPSHSPATQLLLRTLKQSGCVHGISTEPWSAIILPDSWDKYLAKLSGKERGKVGYRRRRLEKRYNARFYECSVLEELPGCLEKLFDLHQKHWNQRGESGSFVSNQRREFYRKMTRSLLIRGCLELWLLDLDGRTVAAQCGLRYGDVVCSLQEGFDPDYAADSVGYVLRSYVLQRLIDKGIRRYDFLAGGEKSKKRWGTDHGKYVDIDLARPSSRAVNYVRIHGRMKWAKESLRSHLPPFLLRVIQTARRGMGVSETKDPALRKLTL